jgi:hypothetical protein
MGEGEFEFVSFRSSVFYVRIRVNFPTLYNAEKFTTPNPSSNSEFKANSQPK